MSRTLTRPSKNGSSKASKPAVAAAIKKIDAGSTGSAAIQIDRIAEHTLHIPIVGVSPLIVNRFSEKEKRKMLASAQGKRTPKEPKDPQAEYEAAFYWLENGTPGFPADAFKLATVGAARFYGKDVTMASLKQFIFVHGERGDDGRALIEIDGEAEMREDVVRVGRGGSENRFRPEFWPWAATLRVTFFPSVITQDSVLSLVDAGGLAVGVGEWRPERDGTFGTYRIDQSAKVKVVTNDAS